MSRLDPRGLAAVALAVVTTVAAGCRQDMHDQPRVEPLGESAFFADGSGARPLPAHTVARGQLREDPALFTGFHADGSLLSEIPMPLDQELLSRGQERFDIFCAPCHGSTGDGKGMVVRRGFKQPSSYHDPRLRTVPIGYYFYVMSNGFGVMASYASQVPVADRWAIAAYIRALQLSQYYDASKLSADERERLDAPTTAVAPPPAH